MVNFFSIVLIALVFLIIYLFLYSKEVEKIVGNTLNSKNRRNDK